MFIELIGCSKEEFDFFSQNVRGFAEFKYTAYGHKGFKFYFEKLELRGLFVPLEHFGCDEYVLRNDTATRVNGTCQLVNVTSKYDLYLSDLLMQGCLGIVIKENLPLEKKFNSIKL